MWHVLHLVAVSAGFLLGLFCILTAAMMYPDEEGQIQNRLEDFWLRLRYFRDTAVSNHTAFMAGIAKLETKFLDRLFGHKLFSVRAIGVSLSITLLSVFLPYAPDVLDDFDLESIPYDWFSVIIGSIILGAACIFFRTRKRFTVAAVIGLLFITWWWPVWLWTSFADNDQVTVEITAILQVVVVVGSFICDVAFILITRRLIRLAGEMTQAWRIVLVVAADVLLACVLVSGYFARGSDYHRRFTGFLETILDNAFAHSISKANFFDAGLALLFVLLALVLLTHRVLWPLIDRTVFRIQDLGTKGRRGILITVGLALLGWSGVHVPDLLKELAAKFGA